MSFSFWNAAVLSSALVDSALAGSHEEASLSWTSVSLEANMPATPKTTIQATSTIHLVTGEVSFPAIWRCMVQLQQKVGTVGIGVSPEGCRIDPTTVPNSSAPAL